MLEIDRASLAVAITEGNFLTPYGENLINQIIDRITPDLYLTDGVPDNALGDDGDSALDLSALEIYTKSNGSWGSGTAIDNNTNAVKLIGPP